MIIRKSSELRHSDVTPKNVYLNRRRFLAAGTAAFAALGRSEPKLTATAKSPFNTDEKLTPIQIITGYNNFYEFGTGKDDPAKNAHELQDRALVDHGRRRGGKAQTFDLDAIMKSCAAGRAHLPPSLRGRLVDRGALDRILVERAAEAGRAQRESEIRGVRELLRAQANAARAQCAGIQFPYVEGLRLDEAMHPLALLAFGMYGETLPNQDGAPVRMVLPWKYGFKSIKSHRQIKLGGKKPRPPGIFPTPDEYGFYSNVNPQVDHPRWSQAKERRLGEFFRRSTLMFNGYEIRLRRSTQAWICGRISRVGQSVA